MADIPKDFPWRPGMLHNIWGRLLAVEFCDDSAWVCGHEQPTNEWGNTANPASVSMRQIHFVFEKDEDNVPVKIIEVIEEGAQPDLTDPATLGALLGAVREAWRSPSAHTRQRGTIRTEDNRIVPAWEVCDLYLDDEGARAIGASKRGGVQCALLLSEADALLAAWNNRPVTR